MNYSTICEQYQLALTKWESDFDDLLVSGQEYEDHFTDWYDNSITLRGATNDFRLTPEQQTYIRDSGFSKCYVCHSDGWETHYNLPDELPVRGWRRRKTPEGFAISYWPEGWTNTEWLDTGYIVIEPDPLDVMN